MGIFGKLGVLVYRFRWGLIVLWVALLIMSILFAPRVGERLTSGDTNVPNSESYKVQRLLDDKFSTPGSSVVVIFQSDNLDATGDKFQDTEKDALDRVHKISAISDVFSYGSTKQESFVSKDGRSSYAVVNLNVSEARAEGFIDDIRSKASSDGLDTYVTGTAAANKDVKAASSEGVKQAEIYALPITLVILVIVFGGLVAAGIPILIGVSSLLVMLTIVYFLAGIFDISVFVSNVAAMLGLGLGIDYALLTVGRFRDELRESSVAEAVARTVETAGHTIFFSGLAVMVGLAGLFFFPISIIRSVGLGGVLVVFTTVLAALTLAPALLGVLGERINMLSIRRGSRREGGRIWRWIGRTAMHRPIVTIILGIVLLALLVYPVSNIQIGMADAQALPKGQESRAGVQILRKDFDYPSLNPIQVAAQFPEDATSAEGLKRIQILDQRITDTGGVDRVRSVYTVGGEAAQTYASKVSNARQQAEAQADKQVDQAVKQQLDQLRQKSGVVPPGTEQKIRSQAEEQAQQKIDRNIPSLPDGVSADGTVTADGIANFLDTEQAQDNKQLQDALGRFASGNQSVVQAVPTDDPSSPKARQTVQRLRDLQPQGVNLQIGGLSAEQADTISAYYGHNTIKAGIFVLIASYLLLAITFRSAIVPLKGLLVNGISIAASLGVIVLILQEGHLSGIFNTTGLGFVDAVVPIMVFCVVFGLSMDYEVFMISRVREAHDRGETMEHSISEALSATGGVVTSAAIILMTITGAFAFTDLLQIKALGIGIAFAVFIAAFVMQMVLVPAIMYLLGDAAWWPGRRKKG